MKNIYTLLFIIAIVFISYAENCNVSSPSEFQSALTAAASDGEADAINLAAGTILSAQH